jgi:HEAT repeat protein
MAFCLRVLIIACAVSLRLPQPADKADSPCPEAKTLRERLIQASQFFDSSAIKAVEDHCRNTPEASAELLRLTRDPDKKVRLEAIRLLTVCAEVDARAIPTLLKTVRDDPEPEVRAMSCRTLGLLARGNSDAAAELVRALSGDKSDVVRAAAAGELQTVCRVGDKAAVRALIAGLKDPSGRVRLASGRSLMKVGSPSEALQPLVAALHDKEEDHADSFARAIGDLGVQAIPALKTAISSEDEVFAARAACALGYVRSFSEARGLPAIRDTTPSIARLLRNPDVSVRKTASHALALIGSDSEPVLDQLTRALADKDDSVRMASMRALGYLGAKASPAAKPICNALSDKESAVRLTAAMTLGDIGEPADVIVPALKAALKDEQYGVRTFAVQSLAKLGPAAAPALPALRALLKDPEKQVRERAKEAIQRIEGGTK